MKDSINIVIGAAGSGISVWLASNEKVLAAAAALLTCIYMVGAIAHRFLKWECVKRGLRYMRGKLPIIAMALLFTPCFFGCSTAPSSVNAPGWVESKTPAGLTIKVQQPENPKGSGFIKLIETREGVSIEGSTGDAFENKNATTAAIFAAFRPYHIAAIGCLILGGLILGFKEIPNRWGWALIGCAAVLAAIGHFFPAYGHIMLYAGIGLVAIGGGYYVYQKGLFKPEPMPRQRNLGI